MKQHAIGEPSLHDWGHEQISQEADARDTALEYFSKIFKSDLRVAFAAERFEKIDGVMADTLEAIFNDVAATERLYRSLFAACVDARSERGELKDLIDREMEKVIEMEFEKAAKGRDE